METLEDNLVLVKLADQSGMACFLDPKRHDVGKLPVTIVIDDNSSKLKDYVRAKYPKQEGLFVCKAVQHNKVSFKYSYQHDEVNHS